LTIDNVHSLRTPAHDYEQRLAQLLPEIDRLDLFLLALLLHIPASPPTGSTRVKAWNWRTLFLPP